jgi:molybdopterin-guanine dinucleotide biosynthesis protein A
MISGEHKSHQKHAALKRPRLGQFGRNEIAILGTPCGNIKQLSNFLVSSLEHLGPLALVDADHKAAEPDQTQPLNFVDKISFRRFDFLNQLNSFQLRPYFNQSRLVLVNGNHFKASAQIVVIDPKKSLDRKLDRLTDPVLVIKREPDVEIPDYLLPYIENLPVLEWEQQQEIADFIETWLVGRKPELKGLVLAGGKSVRMQRDKGALEYHGISQRKYVFQQLQGMGLEAYVSCRQDQLQEIENDTPVLPDTFQGLGPMGALLSAFREDPDAAWLVVACDLPYLTNETIEYLVNNRDVSKLATTFQSPYDEFPEPLIAIWEPRSYSILLSFLSQGYSCPRKVLINSDISLLQAPDPQALTNVNHPEEYEMAVANLKSKT